MTEDKVDYDNELKSGKYLFKYCKFDVYALEVIINKTLYFSSPEKLNDPLDSKFILNIKNPNNFSQITKDIIKESLSVNNARINLELRDASLEMGNIESQEKLFKDFLTHLQNTESGICCFSRTHSNHLLWSHYTDGDKGLCFVFDEEKLHESFKKRLLSQKIRKYKIVHHRINYGRIPKLNIWLYKSGEIGYSDYHLFSKVADWKYEKEYRFVLKLNANKSSILDTTAFDPFLGFDDDCLKYIIVGSKMSEEHKNMVRNLSEKGILSSQLIERKVNFELKIL